MGWSVRGERYATACPARLLPSPPCRRGRTPRKESGTHAQPAWTPPRELADLLDSLAKNQQEQAHLLKAVRTWAQAQERTVTEAKDKARDAVIREIKAAADKL